MNRTEKEQIIQYFIHTENDFKWLWDLKGANALHYGFWTDKTRTLKEALLFQNQYMADKIGVNNKDIVLDSGCGFGGSSFYLAEKYNCRVKGISIVDRQVQSAKQKVKERNLSEILDFLLEDYSQTNFEDSSFSLIWNLESFCYAGDTEKFFVEAYRLLKPGGRIIIADGFAKKEILSREEVTLMNSWLNGWGVSNLESAISVTQIANKVGLINCSFENVNHLVLPSSKRLFTMATYSLPIAKVLKLLNLRNNIQIGNILSAKDQYVSLKQNLWEYGIFYAYKPI